MMRLGTSSARYPGIRAVTLTSHRSMFRDSDRKHHATIVSKIFFQRLPNNSGIDSPKRTRIRVFKLTRNILLNQYRESGQLGLDLPPFLFADPIHISKHKFPVSRILIASLRTNFVQSGRTNVSLCSVARLAMRVYVCRASAEDLPQRIQGCNLRRRSNWKKLVDPKGFRLKFEG